MAFVAFLMSMRGDDVETIAAALGVDVPTAQAALDEASRTQTGMIADLRAEIPKEPSVVPASFTTRDGLVVRLTPDLATPDEPGVWSLIVGRTSVLDSDPLEQIIEHAADPHTAPMASILAAAERIDAANVLARTWEEDQPVDEEPEAHELFDESAPSSPPPPIPSRIVRKPGLAVLAQVPVATGEDALAALGFGNWNACPPPEEHVSILRYWRRRYGARLRAMADDILELDVAEPPMSFDAALPLAREQYAYAGDIVMQSEHDTIGVLAAALVGSRHWHFWWD